MTDPTKQQQTTATPARNNPTPEHNPTEEMAPAFGGRNLPTPQALNAVERYDGKADAHAWLDSLSTIADLYNWSDDVCLCVAKIRLAGPAQRWSCLRKFHDWEDFQEQFTRRFGETTESAIARLSRCFQKPNESPKAFADRFLEDAERAGRTEDAALVHQFLCHLRPELRREAARKRPRTIEDIVDFCNYWLGATAEDPLWQANLAEPYKTSNWRKVRFDEGYNPKIKSPTRDLAEADTKWPEERNRYNDNSDRAAGGSSYRSNRFNDRSSNNNGNNSRPFRRDNPNRSYNPSPARSAAADNAPASDIDNLTKQFERLRLDNDSKLKEKDKELRHLRYLLQQKQATESTGVNYMLPCDDDSSSVASDECIESSCSLPDDCCSSADCCSDAEPASPTSATYNPAGDSYYMDPCPGDTYEEEGDIDPDYLTELLGHMFTKRDAERLYERMPHKRQAIQVNGPSPYVPRAGAPPPPPVAPPTTQAPETGGSAPRMPRQRAPFNVPPYQGPPTAARPNHGNAAATASRPATTTAGTAAAAAAGAARDATAANSVSTAARLANSMGQELATKMKENLKFEVCSDTTVVPQAVLTCMAGHLASDARLIEQGQNMARQVETVVHKMSPGKRASRPSTTAGIMNLAQPSSAAAAGAAAAADTAAAPAADAADDPQLRHSSHKGATCTVWVKVNGRPVKAVVDTGACTTAITKDCLRRADLLDYLRADLATSYINADGRKSKGCGRAPGLVLTIGDEDTVICPTITAATSYDMLLGHDVLELLKAKVDVGEQTLTIQRSADDWVSIPLLMSHSRRPTAYTLQPLEPNSNPGNDMDKTTAYTLQPLTPADRPGNYMDQTAAYRRLRSCDIPAHLTQRQRVCFIWSWHFYCDAVFTLPPQPPSAPGWYRCFNSDTPGADSNDYQSWMEQSACFINLWEDQLKQYLDSKDSCVLQRMQEMKELAAKHILQGDYIGNYPLPQDDNKEEDEFWRPPADDKTEQLLGLKMILEHARDETSCSKQHQTLQQALKSEPVLAAAAEKIGWRPATRFLQHLDPTGNHHGYVEQAAAYYRQLDTPAHFSQSRKLEALYNWVHYCDAVFTLPPQPPNAPGWSRCISDNARQAQSRKYEHWMDFRATRMDDWEHMLWKSMDMDLSALQQRMQEMQELAFQQIMKGDYTGTYPTYSSEDVYESYYADADDCSEASTDDEETRELIMAYYMGLAADNANHQPPQELLEEDMQSLSDTTSEASSQPPSGNADDNDPTTWRHWNAELTPQQQAAVEGVWRALENPYEDMSPDVSAYLAFLDSAALAAQPSAHPTEPGAAEDNNSIPDSDIPDLIEDSESDYGEEDMAAAFGNPWPTAPHQGHPSSTDLPPEYSLDNFGKQVIYFRGDTATISLDEQVLDATAAPFYPSTSPLHYDAEWQTTEDGDFIVLPMPQDAPGDPCSFPEDDALEYHGIEALAQLIDTDNCDLTPEQRQMAQDFLYYNADVFCLSPEQLGRCTVGCHVVDTGDAEPIKQTYYKMPFKKYEQMREHIDYLLSLGLIRESTSPWASPAHLVPKPKGEPGATRFVIDYRAVNAISKKDAHPLPTVNGILYNLGQARYVSCCDLMNGYWQLPLHPDSVATSAFVTPWGIYEWLVTPFGLTGAPASFQRIMQNLMRDFIGKFAFVYLDDFIAYSSTFEDHLEHLGKIFDKLRSAGLKINPKKCSLFKQQVTFLGFVVDQTGLHPDPRLLSAIEDRQPPRNPKEVASFLGLTGYFRRFVEGYSKIAEPLTRLLRRTEPWSWSEEQQQAFEELKQRLISYPVLRRIDFSLPFKVYTDASIQAIGAILCQRDPNTGAEYVCGYHSKKLTPTEKNWSISELECYAVVDALCNAWKDVLLGHNGLTVVTDHTALRFLLTSKHLTGRLARWSLRMQELMPLTLEYRKGSLHQSVDALTRDPTFDTDNQNPGDNTPATINQLPNAAPTTTCRPMELNQQATEVPVYCFMAADNSADTTYGAHNSYNPAGEQHDLAAVSCDNSNDHWSDNNSIACMFRLEDCDNPPPSDNEGPEEEASLSHLSNSDDAASPTPSEEEPLLTAMPTLAPLATEDPFEFPPATNPPDINGLPPCPACPPVPFVPWQPPADAAARRRRPLRICIDGNIGSGKSTIMDMLNDTLSLTQWHVMTEPVVHWEDLLGPFYEAPLHSRAKEALAALLQVQVLCAYAIETPTQEQAPWIVMERGPWSSLAVFLQAQELPYPLERVVYDAAHCMSDNLAKAMPTAIIYLKADPEVCLQRVNSRQRPGEESMTLGYLQSLNSAYELAISSFAGTCIQIDANRPAQAVFEDVFEAIGDIMSTDPQLYDFYLPHSRPLAGPDIPRVNAAVTIPTGPDAHRDYPGHILMMDTASKAGASPTASETSLGSTARDSDLPSTPPPPRHTYFSPYKYAPVPLGFLYQEEVEVPVLFQNGPGKFGYSRQFQEEYIRRFGIPVNPKLRIDHRHALEVYADLGPWACNGPTANIQIAIVPRKAQHAIKIAQIHDNGAEAIYVDSELYTRNRYEELAAAATLQARFGDISYDWRDSLKNEAYTLDGWIRLVRLRPLQTCGLQSPSPAFYTNTVQPLAAEHEPFQPAACSALRLASSIPHLDPAQPPLGAILQPDEHLPQLNLMSSTAQKRKQRSSRQQNDREPSIDPNLACTVCGDDKHERVMIICSKCNEGFHTFCVGLQFVPHGDWRCKHCCPTRLLPYWPETYMAPVDIFLQDSPTESMYEPAEDDEDEDSPSPCATGKRKKASASTKATPAAATPARTSTRRQQTTNKPSLTPTTPAHLEAAAAAATPQPLAARSRPNLAAAFPAAPATTAEATTNPEEDTGNEEEDEEDQASATKDIWEDEPVLHYLQHKSHDSTLLPSSSRAAMKKELKRIRKRASNYRYDSTTGQLFRLPTRRYPAEREVPPVEERECIIWQMHETMGHPAAIRLAQAVHQRYYFPGVVDMAKALVARCDSCLRCRALFKQQPQLKPIPPSPLCSRWHLDTMGPYNPTRSGNKHIYLAIESTSRWCEAIAAPDCTAEGICAFVMDRLVSAWGTPQCLVADNGHEFTSQYVSMLKELGIQDIRSSAYHPQGNGAAESAVKQLLHALQRTVQDQPETWDEKLPTVLMGLRNLRSSATGYTPHFLMTGRHAVLPTERRRQANLAPAAQGAAATPADNDQAAYAAVEEATQALGAAIAEIQQQHGDDFGSPADYADEDERDSAAWQEESAGYPWRTTCTQTTRMMLALATTSTKQPLQLLLHKTTQAAAHHTRLLQPSLLLRAPTLQQINRQQGVDIPGYCVLVRPPSLQQ
jgi:thymidylate kinase/transposase InsO family protein